MDIRSLMMELCVDHALEDFVVLSPHRSTTLGMPFILEAVLVAVGMMVIVLNVQVVRIAAPEVVGVIGILPVPAARAPFKRGFDSAESDDEKKRKN